MSAPLEIVVGSHADFPLQCWNRGGQTQATFGASDVMTASVYRGQDEAALFAPTVAWYTADGGTGYGTGRVTATILTAQAATLEPGGEYTLEVWCTPAGQSAESFCAWRGPLRVLAAPGTATQAVTPYCALKDVLRYAPWVRLVQGFDTDREGFYDQRLEARQWLDQAILNNYRGAFVGLFETHSTAAFAFGYAGWRRSLGPSPSLQTYLDSNYLLVKPYVVRACAHHAAGLIGLAQIGVNNQQAALGAYHRDEAERLIAGITAEVDLNADGIGELFINLGSTNTLFT
jgi:hypothetical protein